MILAHADAYVTENTVVTATRSAPSMCSVSKQVECLDLHQPSACVQIAPMLSVTDKHFRIFFRGITRRAELWTEMHVDSTLLHTHDTDQFLAYDDIEQPLVCQLGGSEPASMGQAARLIQQYRYDEVNINVGCPSTKVAGRGCFGVSLMRDADRVKNIVYQIRREAPNLRVSVKTRCGVDNNDSIKFLQKFVSTVSEGGCNRFIIHARKAWLNGVSPKCNRHIPPLQYHKVYALAKEYPSLFFSLNGGVTSLDQIENFLLCKWRPNKPELVEPLKALKSDDTFCEISQDTDSLVLDSFDKEASHMMSSPQSYFIESIRDSHDHKLKVQKKQLCKAKKVFFAASEEENAEKTLLIEDVVEFLDQAEKKNIKPLEGIMLGRAAMNNPCMFSTVDSRFYGVKDPVTSKSPYKIVANYMDYLNEIQPGPSEQKHVFPLLKPVLGLLSCQPGGKRFRFELNEAIRLHHKTKAPAEILELVLEIINDQFPNSLHNNLYSTERQ